MNEIIEEVQFQHEISKHTNKIQVTNYILIILCNYGERLSLQTIPGRALT